MKKSDFLGWKEVFAFSFEQGIKEKAFVIFLVIMFLVMLLATPVTTFFKQDEGEVKSSSIRTLQVYDLTGLPIAYEEAKFQDGYDKVQVVLAGTTLDAYETYVEKLAKEEAEAALAVKVEYSPEQGFVLTYVKPAEGVEEEDAEGLADQFTAYFELAKLTAIDVTIEQYAFLNRPVNTESVFLNASGEVVPPSQEESISLDQYYILLAGIVIITLFVSFSGGSIATSIVTEKSTRVIEYLMINVRPMALLTGKILGSLALTVVQFGVIGIGYVGSKYLTSALFGEQTQTESSFLEFLVNIDLFSAITAATMILAGILIFAILAGLAGASASKLEETQESMKLFQMAMLVGTYGGIFLCIMQLTGMNAELLVSIFSLIPIFAPFIVPANLLLGEISAGYAWISIVLTLAVGAALFWFAARVYEALIFHTGKVLKFKDIIGIAKARRGVSDRKGEC